MAEAVISSIAGEIVAFLGSRALENVGKLCSVKHELEALKVTVSTIQAVLDHAEEQYYQSRQIKDWVEKLKDAFYDGQDVLEEFNTEALRRELRGHSEISKEVRTFFSSSNQLALNLKMSYKVRAVRERIEAIKARKGFHLEERPVDSQVERQRRKREEAHSFIREGDIKGRDGDKKAVKEFLLDSDAQENVSVLPIVGIGGLGKTTLAQYVYNDEMVSKHFQLKMWVCVSDDFDKEKIVKNMIVCAKKKEPTATTMEWLQEELRGEIDGKRYLLVLDDWWNEEQEKWLSLRTLLLGGARGSKILITTRLPSVAKTTILASPYLLQDLSESASLELLMQMACCKEEERQDPEMLAIGKDIVRKCSGVPLAIRTIGSLLIGKSKQEWSQFKENELPHVSQREEGIISILKFSYDHLPSHLKRCFAFCSLFPKDYEINTQTLVNLWMAEGFIQPSNKSQHLEDIAHGYFMDLLYSNFFQDYQEDEETCKMHDLMHDLACSVAGIECQMVADGTKSIHERTRHISMGGLPISRLKASPLRTFLMPRGIIEADLHLLMQSFKRLHILDMHDTYVEKVPRSIGKLKYLTYLDFSDNQELKRLPNSITRLQNLQTLNLNSCHSLEELPRGIRKLVSLRNLDIDGCSLLGYVPRGVGQLTSLHKLTRFILPKDKALAKNCCRLGELKGLNYIRRRLRIENLGSVMDAIVESKEANLEGKQYLETLELVWGDSDTDDAVIVDKYKALLDGLQPHPNLQKLAIYGYKGGSFPRWMTALTNLVELSLSNCTELDSSKEESSNIISDSHDGLKSLRSVDFNWLPKLTSLPQWLPQARNLESLEILFCHNLRELPEQIEALQLLQRLVISYCDSLTSLPEGMRMLASLTSLYIAYCAELDSSKEESGNIILDSHDGLKSLRSVEFGYLPKLASLPQWLPQASDLESLEIWFCDNLRELPEQIVALQSLQRLVIFSCPLLTSLPEGIQTLASLTSLKISYCAELDFSKEESGNIISDSHDGLKSLRSVDFDSLSKLASLPLWLPQAKNLESLEIWFCDNLRELPERIETLQSLQRLVISYCDSLTSLPEGMRMLASLTSLYIAYCAELDSSKEESGNIILDSHDGLKSLRSVEFRYLPKLASLPRWLPQANNLESLEIWFCDNLRELPEQIVALQSLQRLVIFGCPSLTSLPEGIQTLASLTSLKISYCAELDFSKEESGNIISDSHDGLKSLRSVYFYDLPELASLPRWLPQASNLESLEILSCDNLRELPEQIVALQSLQRLVILGCPLLTSLPKGIQTLASLTSLRIQNCLELDSSKEESGNIISDSHDGLKSLRSVEFICLPKLASLPQWLLQANNLQHLHIWDCRNFKELPEWIGALQSLQRLEISYCPSLTSLPEGIRRLASLTSLSIVDCPLLVERCRRDAGEDWHKIAHISCAYVL